MIDSLEGCTVGGPGIIFGHSSWTCCSVKANSWADFCWLSYSKVLSKCSALVMSSVKPVASHPVFCRFQFSSVAQSRPTFCDPVDCSMPGFPVHHQLPEPTRTHVHLVADGIQSSHPLSFPSPPAFNASQIQGPFQWVSSSHQVAKILEFQFQHQSFQWIFRTDLL